MKYMIKGIGIDSVEIERFKDWHAYSNSSLSRIFSKQEIDYCLSVPAKSAERFAARFAVREAFLKALQQVFLNTNFALLTVCKAIQIDKTANGAPIIAIDWKKLKVENPKNISFSISWTHNKTDATAILIIYCNQR